MARGPTLEPLRDIEIRTTVGGEVVTGTITHLWPNDILIVMTSPASGWGSGLHVPAFAMARCNWLATYRGSQTIGMTDRGRRAAEDLLQTIYRHVRGAPSGWNVYRVDDPTRVE